MADSPRRVDLRLTIPAAAPFVGVAVELTEKFATYAGAAAADAKSLSEAVAAAIAPVAEAQPDKPIDMKMSAGGHELVVTAQAGATTRQASCALPD